MSEQPPAPSVLTRELLQQHVKQYMGSPAMLIAVAVIVISLFLMVLLPIRQSIGIVWVILISAVFAFFFGRFLLKGIAAHIRGGYTVVEATCRKRTMSESDDGMTYYYLHFEGYGSHNLTYPAGWPYSSVSLYRQTRVGDTCYLVVPIFHKSPILVYSAKDWELDRSGFRKKGKQYLPR